jgi:glycosyltransferase involved in cell wall biosynthesis
MNNKKFCQVISGYYRNDPRIFQRQCKSLTEAGFSVSILTNDDQPEETLEDISIYSTNNYWASRLRVLIFAKKQFLKRAIELDADIYQMHSPELLSLGIALRKAGKIVVYDAHEDLPKHIIEKDWLPRFIRKPLSFVVQNYMNTILQNYHAIISPHSHVVDNLKEINPNTTLITNFAKLLPSKEIYLDEYLQRKQIICYSGTVYLHSNQISILDALKELPDVTYNIAGYCSPDYLEVLSKHESYKKLNYIGRINWADLAAFYKKARIGFVLIDYKLNLGGKRGTYAVNKIFEYMEAALPIICSDYDLWQDIINEYNCGICVEPGNVKQLKDAITFLLNNPIEAYKMGQNGRRAVLQKYNWSTQHEVYINIFKELENDIKLIN